MTLSDQFQLEIHCIDEADTVRVATELAVVARKGDLITLDGDLGAGKSVFARAFIRALVGEDELEVPSPTYLVALDYQTANGINIRHADLYRIADPQEMDELGFENDSETITIVEWPQNGAEGMGAPDLAISITIEGENERVLQINCSEESASRYGRSALIRAFLNNAGYQGFTRTPFAADASARNYEWITKADNKLILMDAPKAPDGPIIRDGLTYSAIAHLAEEVNAFVAVSEALSSNGFCAPEIYAHDLDQGLVVLEYLGSGSILDDEGNPVIERYCECARALAHLHQFEWKKKLAHGHIIPDYNEAAMQIEASLLNDWYLDYCEIDRNRHASEFASVWHELSKKAQGFEKSLVLRDMHSPNVIWREAEKGLTRIGFIDVQDALLGPCTYDVASLAQDARVYISEADEARIVDAYKDERQKLDPDFDQERFQAEYSVMGALRTTKVLGIFVRLKVRDGKPAYLNLLKSVREYLERNLRHDMLNDYRNWYERAFNISLNDHGLEN